MPKFRIEKLDPKLAVPNDVPGLAVTVDVPDLPNPITSWRALLLWFRTHRATFARVWKALQTLLGLITDEDPKNT